MFPTCDAAQKRIGKLCQRGVLRIVGFITEPAFRPGRPVNVYCTPTWRPHRRCLAHERLATRLQLLYPQGRWERGYDFGHPYPDAKVLLGGVWYFVEADNDTEGQKKWRRRVDAYAKLDDTVLVVTTSDDRVEQLLSWSDGFETACFTTIDRVRADPWGKVWKTIERQEVSLVKPVG